MVNIGQKFRKSSDNGKLKLNGFHRDISSALAIFDSSSVCFILKILLYKTLKFLVMFGLRNWRV